MKRSRLIVAFLVLIGAFSMLTTMAIAEVFPWLHLADSSYHTWCRGTAPNWASMYDQIMDNAVDDLPGFSEEEGECYTTGPSQTDVVLNEEYIDGRRGAAGCSRWERGRCDRWLVRLDRDLLEKGSHDFYDLRKTLCHEVGHTFGLDHHPELRQGVPNGWAEDCTMSGDVTNENLFPEGPTALQYRRFGHRHRETLIDFH